LNQSTKYSFKHFSYIILISLLWYKPGK